MVRGLPYLLAANWIILILANFHHNGKGLTILFTENWIILILANFHSNGKGLTLLFDRKLDHLNIG